MRRSTRQRGLDGSGYAISGFALLTLTGPKMKVEYINEDGSLFASETWPTPLPVSAKAKGKSKNK
jgi:hypothetical protein